MEISFWRYLYKEHPGLPLKQRIPEVAIFHGHVLQDCYYSNTRGLLQKRAGAEVTREALLDRLLALASKRTDGADLSPDTPAAILRRPPPAASSAPHVATVLSTSELMDLLKEPSSPRAMQGDFSQEWSVQSIVTPAEDLRTVAVYSRGALREERIDVIGRSYQAMYQVGVPSTGSTALAAVPEAQAMKVEAKAQALVQYVQHFHQRSVEGLLAEFVQDSSGRVILNTFWKISFADASARPILPDSMLADGTGQAFMSTGRSCHNEYSLASTALPAAGSAEATLASQSCSTDGFGSTSRPTSAGFSRPTSASRERPGSAKGSRPNSAGGPRRQNGQLAEDAQDLQILEDDDVGGDDDIDAEIERLQAARIPSQVPQRFRNRPTHAHRTDLAATGWSRAQNQVLLLLELWDGGRFLGEVFLQPGADKPTGEAIKESVTRVLDLGRPTKSIRADVRKAAPMQNGSTGAPACIACRVSASTTWDQRRDAPGTLRLSLHHAELVDGPEGAVTTERHVRAQLWSCCPQTDGFECKPLWSSKDAAKAASPQGAPAQVLLFEWSDQTINVSIPAVPAAASGLKKRPFSARARIGPVDNSTAGPAKMRPASARLSGRRAGSTERLAPDQRSPRPGSPTPTAKPSRPRSAQPKRPLSARKAKPPAAKSKPNRPSSARPASAKGPVILQANSARARPATDAVRTKQTLHSQQLLSRYQMERDQRTRLISILARQLERQRDMMPTWVEQRGVLRVVVSRAEEQVAKCRVEVDDLLAEREQIENFYLQKQAAVVRNLSQEKEKALESVQVKKQELEQSLELEQETTQELMREERRNDELRVMLEQTVSQLENAQFEMASWEEKMQFMDAQLLNQRVDYAVSYTPEGGQGGGRGGRGDEDVRHVPFSAGLATPAGGAIHMTGAATPPGGPTRNLLVGAGPIPGAASPPGAEMPNPGAGTLPGAATPPGGSMRNPATRTFHGAATPPGGSMHNLGAAAFPGAATPPGGSMRNPAEGTLQGVATPPGGSMHNPGAAAFPGAATPPGAEMCDPVAAFHWGAITPEGEFGSSRVTTPGGPAGGIGSSRVATPGAPAGGIDSSRVTTPGAPAGFSQVNTPGGLAGGIRIFPEASLMHARARMEAHQREQEQTMAEKEATKAEILKAKQELELSRMQAQKLEDFVRKIIHHGSASSGYLLDPASKKEAAAILASAAKLQAARMQSSPSRKRQLDMGQDISHRRVCSSCDEYDPRWPPASVGIQSDRRHITAVP